MSWYDEGGCTTGTVTSVDNKIRSVRSVKSQHQKSKNDVLHLLIHCVKG